MSDNVRALIAEARSEEPTDWRSLAWHLADALEASLAERDSLTATVERARGLLGELDLDSGRVTAPGTAWGSILREARDALDSASDDTEWEYGIQVDSHLMMSNLEGVHEWLRKGHEAFRRIPSRFIPAGPWVAIEKGGE